MTQLPQQSALILSDDARDPDALRSILAANGYAVARMTPIDATVEETLRESTASLVLAHIDLKRDTLAQPDAVAVLGLLQREPTFADGHVVLVLTRTPEVIENVLGQLLDRLGVPVLAMPCTQESARATLELARAHQHHVLGSIPLEATASI